MTADTLLPADAIPTAPPPVHRCSSCGRPLTDPTSRARQVGPDCWAKDHPDSQPGPVRSTAGVGDRDLIDEIGDTVTDQTDPDASRRDALTWAIILCGGDFTCRPDTESDCPDRGQHTPTPDGYVDRAEWAGRMIARGALQCRCSTCGLYAIWTEPRRPMPDESGRRPSRRW